MENQHSSEELSRVIEVLEALKQASQELKSHNSAESNSLAIKALLELETESDTILSEDPHLCALSQHLADLKTLVESLHKTRGRNIVKNFLARRGSNQSICRVAGSIESEIQAWIDRESVESLGKALRETDSVFNEDELVCVLTQFENRVNEGFNRELQNLVLKARIFQEFERVLCEPKWPKRVKEHCAYSIAALIKFNKDVFVGQVLMGSLIHALVSMASWKSMEVLGLLIRSIKSPFVDEIESNGEIPKIISYLDYKDIQMKVLTMDCILEIGYFGRKEAIDAMLKEGLIKKLVELQRSELGGDLIDGKESKGENGERKREQRKEVLARASICKLCGKICSAIRSWRRFETKREKSI